MNRCEEAVFLKNVPVADSIFLPRAKLLELLADCGYDGEIENYIEWNTDWDFSTAAKELSEMLMFRGIPRNTPILINMNLDIV